MFGKINIPTTTKKDILQKTQNFPISNNNSYPPKTQNFPISSNNSYPPKTQNFPISSNNSYPPKTQKFPISSNNSYPPKTKVITKQQKTNKPQLIKDKKQQVQEKVKKKNEKSLILQKQQLREQLKASKFRLLNQFLYTNDSKIALEHFQHNVEDFQIYHQGFRNQTIKWQVNPINVIANYLIKHYISKNMMNGENTKKKKLIVDLGCGQGELYEILKEKQKNKKILDVRSFDLVACKPHIEVADMADLPVQDNTAEVCVFCLSLMGINYLNFILQARRILKKNEGELGRLLIAEVQSRSDKWDAFIEMIESLGFQCTKNSTIQSSEQKTSKGNKNGKQSRSSDYFRIMYFKIDPHKEQREVSEELINLSRQLLRGCVYKKR